MASENTKKSTSTSVRRSQSWYLAKYKTELNLNSISEKISRYLLYINRDVKLSVLSLGHFISFSFATEEVKCVNYFPSRVNDLEI